MCDHAGRRPSSLLAPALSRVSTLIPSFLSSGELAAAASGGGRSVRVIPLRHPLGFGSISSSPPWARDMGPLEWAEAALPCVAWMRKYRWKEDLQADLAAGITVGVMLVPQDGKLQRELRGETGASAPPPLQVAPRGSRKTPNSDTIFGSYPTRRSMWCPKQTPARAHNNVDPAAVKQQARPTLLRNLNPNSRGTKTSNSPLRRSCAPQFPFGLTNSAATYQTLLVKKLHQIHQTNSDLVMTTTPSGVIIHWPDMDPVFALQEANDPFKVQGISPLLPFQEGRELSVISDNEQPGPNNLARQLYATIHDESDDEAVSYDAPTVDGETQVDTKLRIERNRSHALRRRHIRMKNLNNDFDNEGIFKSPAANIMFVVSWRDSKQPPTSTSLKPVSKLRQSWLIVWMEVAPLQRARVLPIVSSHYGSSAAKSKGTHRPYEEPPRPAHSQVIPPTDARHHINNIRAGRTRATSHTTDSTGGCETPSPDVLPGYTRAIRVSSFPRKFKPSGITNFDGKQDPNIWLCQYSSAIEAAGEDDISKMLYFPIAMEQGPLTWLESLCPDSIDSWHALKKAFVSNYQGSFERPDSKYELRACKQKPDESLLFRDFGHNRPRDQEEFRELVANWMDTDDQEREGYGKRHQDNNKDQPRDSFNRKTSEEREETKHH
nr:unnamed protein product [Digitaria exilis]